MSPGMRFLSTLPPRRPARRIMKREAFLRLPSLAGFRSSRPSSSLVYSGTSSTSMSFETPLPPRSSPEGSSSLGPQVQSLTEPTEVEASEDVQSPSSSSEPTSPARLSASAARPPSSPAKSSAFTSCLASELQALCGHSSSLGIAGSAGSSLQSSGGSTAAANSSPARRRTRRSRFAFPGKPGARRERERRRLRGSGRSAGAAEGSSLHDAPSAAANDGVEASWAPRTLTAARAAAGAAAGATSGAAVGGSCTWAEPSALAAMSAPGACRCRDLLRLRLRRAARSFASLLQTAPACASRSSAPGSSFLQASRPKSAWLAASPETCRLSPVGRRQRSSKRSLSSSFITGNALSSSFVSGWAWEHRRLLDALGARSGLVPLLLAPPQTVPAPLPKKSGYSKPEPPKVEATDFTDSLESDSEELCSLLELQQSTGSTTSASIP
mmetsp:Transcript_21115/g.63459  ORF Transcript_21115/g.63459 Transcript_21115/m.63459 type:complete len:440 (+) Transcript_21115:101-1420(+)